MIHNIKYFLNGETSDILKTVSPIIKNYVCNDIRDITGNNLYRYNGTKNSMSNPYNIILSNIRHELRVINYFEALKIM
jgi:hypothetical protein